MNTDLPDSPALEALGQAFSANAAKQKRQQRELARPLGHALIERMEKSGRYRALVPLGHEMVDALWPANGGGDDAMRALQAKMDAISDHETQLRAEEMLARLGHMHQLAGIALRDFELAHTTTPKTAEAFLNGFGTGRPYTAAADAVAALNRPRIEFTFTAHPTNTNSESGMTAQRELGRALHELQRNPDIRAVGAALDHYIEAPLLPEREGMAPGFTVGDETSVMLTYLNNLYLDLDDVYASYDRALSSHKFRDTYHPEQLKLNLGLHSWGSSADKDGNGKVNADTTLYALAAHHQQILQRYHEALEKLPGFDDWKGRIDAARRVTSTALKEIEDHLKNGKGYLSEEEFDALSHQMQRVIAPLDAKQFEADLQAAYQQSKQPETLSLLRHVHTFGFSFGTLEYRETAEEFTRIMKALIPGYEKMDEKARCQALIERIENPSEQHDFFMAWEKLSGGCEGKPYSKEDVAPIAYQTRKRLQLARDFPHAIDNHVLAECQDRSNLLELLLLQHATEENGHHATLGIVPLFEDSDTLEKSPTILSEALNTPIYRQHLNEVAALHGGKPAQQIQLAHSDNARRNGLPAARGLIYQAHTQLRNSMDVYNNQHSDHVALQFYEGGSLSDSYRGGTRAISAAINEYGLHEFSKMTVQGGDLLNYFNLPHSTYRLLMRNFTHNAARLDRVDPNESAVARPGIARGYVHCIMDALIATKDEYKDKLFHAPIINRFLESVGFAEESKAGNIGSRAVARANGSKEVDVTNVRTIAFSEGFQHAGLNPSWLGSLELPALLKTNGIETESPAALKHFYDKVPFYKDTIDRMLFGLVRTDMSYLEERSGNHELMGRFRQEYEAAFKLCMETYTGKKLEHFTEGRALTPAEQHAMLIKEVYPHVADVFADQDRYTDLVRHVKRHWLKDDNGLEGTAAQDNFVQRTTLHNATDTIIHGRLPLIDDPTYATLYCAKHEIQRPWVTSPSRALAA